MSYSLVCECGSCPKADKCVDSDIVLGAIQTIHCIGQAKGHFGGGSIVVNCSNKKHYLAEVEQTASTEAQPQPCCQGQA